MAENETPNPQQPDDDGHQDPKNWKLGIFYFNKKDKRVFPPKRFGIGWTVNFANPISIGAMLGILVLFQVVAWLVVR